MCAGWDALACDGGGTHDGWDGFACDAATPRRGFAVFVLSRGGDTNRLMTLIGVAVLYFM